MMRGFPVVIVLALLLGLSSQAFGAAKIGSSCSKVSSFQQGGKTLLVCDRIKKKKVWRKATPIEFRLNRNEQLRIERKAKQTILDTAKAESDRLALEAKVKVEAEAAQAAADAVAKAAVAKAAAESTAKAAADKAAAEATAKAAVDKAAADKAAADIPSLITGRFFSGPDLDDTNWKWVAVEIKNSSQYNILSHRSYDVLIGDSNGEIVDSTWEPGFPLLLANQSGWYVTTQFNTYSSSQVVFRKTYSTQPSPLSASEFPSAENPRLVTSPYYSSRKAISFTIKNNSISKILSSSSKAFAVVFNASGIPVYAESGFIGKSVLPGGQTEVTIGDFTFNGDNSYILVTVGINIG